MRSLLVALLSVGCAADRSVTVGGIVLSSPEPSALPLTDGEVVIRGETGAVFDRADLGADGRFEAEAPLGLLIYADVAGPELATASFTGVSGSFDWETAPGDLYGFPRAELDAWAADFAGCPGLGERGAALGEVVWGDLFVPDTDVHPFATGAIVSVIDGEGVAHAACYLDDDGVAYAPDATFVGLSGRFFVPDLPIGVATLRVEQAITEYESHVDEFPVRVPDGVAPRLPISILFF